MSAICPRKLPVGEIVELKIKLPALGRSAVNRSLENFLTPPTWSERPVYVTYPETGKRKFQNL